MSALRDAINNLAHQDIPLQSIKDELNVLLDQQEAEGMSSFNGGTIGVEVLNDTELTTGGQAYIWLFDSPYIQTSNDVTIDGDNQTFRFNADGWYQVWYSFAVKASATTVKAQAESQITTSNNFSWFAQGSLGETQPHLDGAVSLADLTTPFTSLPVFFVADETLQIRAGATYTAGNVGHAILSSNSYASITRLF